MRGETEEESMSQAPVLCASTLRVTGPNSSNELKTREEKKVSRESCYVNVVTFPPLVHSSPSPSE